MATTRLPPYTPQLATLVREPPAGDDWLHEIKLDGYRLGCRIERGDVRLLTRNGLDWTDRFPWLRDAASRLPVRSALLDGEAVALLPDGRSSFQALQAALGRAGTAAEFAYLAFDLLHLDGTTLTAEPLEARKARLATLLERVEDGRIRYSAHTVGDGAAVLAAACRLGLEGIVSKRRDAPYHAGRTTTWLKTKCIGRQEVVIGGWTDPSGSRTGVGALLVGVHGDGRLRYAGKVGTGFTAKSAAALRARLDALATPTRPFADGPTGAEARAAHWVRPTLVAEVAFTEWTRDGRLRHPSFQGLREDKPATAVVREQPAADPAPAPRPPRPQPAAKRAAAADPARPVVAGVPLSNPDRVLFSAVPLTKLGLARYYEGIAEHVLPHVVGRPLTLVRCPTGVDGGCFYMKHSRVWAPAALRRLRIREKTKVGEYLVVDDLAGLVGLVQIDVLEVHTWNSTADRLEEPNRFVLDLDPGPDVDWPAVVDAARLVRDVLAGAGLRSFVKTTGGRGLHVVVPLAPVHPWDACLAASRAVAETIVAHDPRRFTTAMPKRGREGKILLDYLRNNRTNTSVAAFSTRAQPTAPVSTPLAWDELSAGVAPDAFTVATVPRRLARLRDDPWADYWTLRQRLPGGDAALTPPADGGARRPSRPSRSR